MIQLWGNTSHVSLSDCRWLLFLGVSPMTSPRWNFAQCHKCRPRFHSFIRYPHGICSDHGSFTLYFTLHHLWRVKLPRAKVFLLGVVAEGVRVRDECLTDCVLSWFVFGLVEADTTGGMYDNHLYSTGSIEAVIPFMWNRMIPCSPGIGAKV